MFLRSSVALTFVVGCAAVGSVDQVPEASRAKAADALWQSFDDLQSHTFILALQPSVTDRVTWAQHKIRILEAAPTSELVLERDWTELPLVQVNAASLDAALAAIDRDEVAAAYPIEQYELTDAESFPLIDQPAAVAAGKIGTGTAVAVLDTGTDYTRADFGSCTSPGVPASCKVAYAADIAPSDGSRDDNGHGTNVAGIVLGVAPGTKIIALDVFTGSGASSTDIITAINWAVANRTTYNIAALNLSLGGGVSTTACTSDAMGIALGTARAAGIAPVVASGNGAYTNAISSPGCAPAAISVGAVYDSNVGGLAYSNCSDPTTAADKITCFSNSASFLTVLAPGALITAAGYTMAGTSQATPHVAGAIAVLHAAFPTDTVDQEVGRLTATGKPITDPRNGITKSRIDLFAALGAPSSDTTPPTGTLAINAGATATRAAAVTLAITGIDASGVATMCITNSTTCTTFETFATTKSWTLAAGDGRKTVTLFLRDKVGNTTTTTSPAASITLDTALPLDGTLTATPGNAAIALAWTGFSDPGSSIASYRVVGASGATAPANCTGTTIYAGSALATTQSALVNGTTYSYRVCAVDGAGNVSSGKTISAAPRPESNPPVGTIKINSGASFTKSLAVALTLVATDETRVAQMCVSDGTACSTFVTYAATGTYTFGAGDGARTLRVWYRDPWGNTSAPVAASIVVDTTAPSGGVLSATHAIAKITASWTAATDAGSGLASYVLVGNAGTAIPAAACTSGTVLYTGTATTFAHTVATKATWTYRVCATDNAGNTAIGSTVALSAL